MTERSRNSVSEEDGPFDKQKEEGKIVLNVGGVKYETLLTTLTAYPDTLLGTMFSDRNRALLHPHNNNEYFFDRNSRAFHYILEFYRTGKLLWEQDAQNLNHPSFLTPVSRLELDEELDYFQIPKHKFQLTKPVTIEETATLVEDFTNMLKAAIEEMRRQLRTRLTITFPLFNFELFAVHPDIDELKELVEPYKYKGSPISAQFGTVICRHLESMYDGCECTAYKEKQSDDGYVRRWEIVVPLAFDNDEVLRRTSLKDWVS